MPRKTAKGAALHAWTGVAISGKWMGGLNDEKGALLKHDPGSLLLDVKRVDCRTGPLDDDVGKRPSLCVGALVVDVILLPLWVAYWMAQGVGVVWGPGVWMGWVDPEAGVLLEDVPLDVSLSNNRWCGHEAAPNAMALRLLQCLGSCQFSALFVPKVVGTTSSPPMWGIEI